MSMIRAEEVLCELMRGREYKTDVTVRTLVDHWRYGHAEAGPVIIELIRRLSEQNERLYKVSILERWRGPVVVMPAAQIRGVPPAAAPGDRRCVPLSEADEPLRVETRP